MPLYLLQGYLITYNLLLFIYIHYTRAQACNTILNVCQVYIQENTYLSPILARLLIINKYLQTGFSEAQAERYRKEKKPAHLQLEPIKAEDSKY